MSKMFTNIEEVRVYIDDLLLITNSDWESHLETLDKVLDRPKCAGLKKEVEAILKIDSPKTRKQLCSFIGMINYNCNMLQGCSKVLAPLASLMSKVGPWKWMIVKQKAFNWAKKIFSQKTLLMNPVSTYCLRYIWMLVIPNLEWSLANRECLLCSIHVN
eukprot:2401569-Ditylum_brightwellii.AAC.1